MMVLWSDEKHSLQIPAIDEHHKQLFLITNRLAEAGSTPDPALRQKTILQFLHRLVSYANYHFEAEEELLIRYGYTQAVQHGQFHEAFRTRIKAYLDEVRDNPRADTDEMLDYLVNWIVEHIQVEDRKYAAFFLDRGIPVQLHMTPGGDPRTEVPGSDVLKLWKDKKMALEIREIDHQHQELVMILQQANDLLLASPGRQKTFLPPIINKLRYYSQFHFSFEEELMSRHGWDQIKAHQELHAAFIQKILAFAQEYSAGVPSLPAEIVAFLKDWTIHHILEEDRKFKDSLGHPGKGA